MCFLQTEGLWQPRIQQVYWCHFYRSIGLLGVSVSYFGNSCNISIFFHYYICYGDLWKGSSDVTITKRLQLPEASDDF